jgi:hypothetical protein
MDPILECAAFKYPETRASRCSSVWETVRSVNNQRINEKLARISGFVANYSITIGSFSNITNMAGQTNNTLKMLIPAIGVQTKTHLTVIANSIYNGTLSLNLSVTGMVTLRSTIESLFVYPTTTVMGSNLINMSLTNLTQNCGDFYTITLNDPTNTTLVNRANNTAFNYASNYNGNNTVLLSYKTDLTTINSNKFFVRIYLSLILQHLNNFNIIGEC